MSSLVSRLSALILVLAFAGVTACSAGDRANSTLPTPAVDAPMVSANGEQTAVIAGGCFWGIQAVFQHTKGVISATSGYSGGSARTAEYELVSTGETGHAESVKLTYDPSKITYGQLLAKVSNLRRIVVHDVWVVRMECSIVLVIGLGWIESLQWNYLGHDGALEDFGFRAVRYTPRRFASALRCHRK